MLDLHFIYILYPCVVASELKAIISIREREHKAGLLLREANLLLRDSKESRDTLITKLEVSVL